MSKKKTGKEPTLAQQAQAAHQTKAEQVATSLAGTEAGTIWNEIKDKSIEMFALPDQKVHMHATPVNIEPSKLYLTATSTAVLPSLEVAVGKAYVVELADRFLIVSRAVTPLTKK
jgi:hypothetical protein